MCWVEFRSLILSDLATSPPARRRRIPSGAELGETTTRLIEHIHTRAGTLARQREVYPALDLDDPEQNLTEVQFVKYEWDRLLAGAVQDTASDPRVLLILFPLALLLLAGGMAAHAVLEVGDAFLPVLALRLCPAMFVAAVTGVGRKRLRVAGLAPARATLSVVHGKGVGPIVACRRPGRGVVARCACAAQQSAVESRVLVACGAILRCALVDTVKVALRARRL